LTRARARRRGGKIYSEEEDEERANVKPDAAARQKRAPIFESQKRKIRL
jgi:hypothetical protein